jgi:hypothetical protein
LADGGEEGIAGGRFPGSDGHNWSKVTPEHCACDWLPLSLLAWLHAALGVPRFRLNGRLPRDIERYSMIVTGIECNHLMAMTTIVFCVGICG